MTHNSDPSATADAVEIERIARRARALSLRTAFHAQDGHLGADMSAMDILCTLYFGVLRVDAQDAADPDRDRFVLSKAHASTAMYSVLSLKGFIPEEELETFGRANSRLSTVVSTRVPGVEFSTGSLGHGLPLATGAALAGRMDSSARRIVVLCGDGELQEGSNWEALMLAGTHGLSNLTLIVDRNLAQKGASTEDINALEPLDDKLRSFGWAVRHIDGHDVPDMLSVLRSLPLAEGRPSCLIAATVKGKGVSFMESDLSWHSRRLTREMYERALAELDEGNVR
ncbi:transketolase [Saccharopolyspora spinosa]|uniref:Transketolase subunit A n=1 Tax=Saccharopolyspora spinosa TaxID=60894 RepID=A0A2N3Y077_SACSN|nr:transketolase [Saccharopolyspora spinosa]PKW16300.1 transketolase subunit A [Saccharopolyspora spinosa]